MVEVRYFGSLASNCTMGTTACCLTHICRRTIHRGRAHRSCTQTTFWSAMGMRIMSVMRWRCPSTTMRRSSQRRSLDIFWKKRAVEKRSCCTLAAGSHYRSARSRRHRLCTAAVRFPAAWHAAFWCRSAAGRFILPEIRDCLAICSCLGG